MNVSTIGTPRFNVPVRAVHVPAKAQAAADPLPTFANAEQYKNYVINLVAQSRVTQAELEAARKALNENKGTDGAVGSAQERLDAVKLQLSLLRDQYPIPSDWTRSKLLFGQGFDKDKFWREQVEAIPGKEVVVTPQAPQAPAPAPATPAPVPADAGDRAGFKGKLRLAQFAKDNSHYANDRDAALKTALGDATKLSINSGECIEVARAAKSLYYYSDNRDAMVKTSLGRGAELAASVQDAIALADAAKETSYYADNRDALVKKALQKAIDLCGSFADMETIVAAAKRDFYYGDNRDAIIKQAMAKPNLT
ncbi:MAG: hypothetical protein JWM80_6181 [Cyanobacteria bacterium RYN_339]|nr:hypothetical protein [Cyanobacteria bacterium RYN_339]